MQPQTTEIYEDVDKQQAVDLYDEIDQFAGTYEEIPNIIFNANAIPTKISTVISPYSSLSPQSSNSLNNVKGDGTYSAMNQVPDEPNEYLMLLGDCTTLRKMSGSEPNIVSYKSTTDEGDYSNINLPRPTTRSISLPEKKDGLLDLNEIAEPVIPPVQVQI